MKFLLSLLFGCAHNRTTFPLTPTRAMRSARPGCGAYVVCLDCGSEFDYDWKSMRVGSAVYKPEAMPLPGLEMEKRA
jgi:hypothetical protein